MTDHKIILYLAVYRSSQDFKNSDSGYSEDEQEKFVHQKKFIMANTKKNYEHMIKKWRLNGIGGAK